MTERDIMVVCEIEYPLTIEEPYDSDVVRQYVQDAIGHTGAIVTEVLIAEGASDL